MQENLLYLVRILYGYVLGNRWGNKARGKCQEWILYLCKWDLHVFTVVSVRLPTEQSLGGAGKTIKGIRDIIQYLSMRLSQRRVVLAVPDPAG